MSLLSPRLSIFWSSYSVDYFGPVRFCIGSTCTVVYIIAILRGCSLVYCTMHIAEDTCSESGAAQVIVEHTPMDED